jgi:hypothetical protein
MTRLTAPMLLACALLAGCGQVARQRAQVRIFTLVRPATVAGYDGVHTYRSNFVCGRVDVKAAKAAPVRRNFYYDANDNSAWIEGVTDRAPSARLYDRINQRVWARCMGLPRPPNPLLRAAQS